MNIFRRAHVSRETRLLLSSCLSVCPNVSARLSLDGFPWTLITKTFTNICRETRNLIKIGQKIVGTLHEDFITFVL